MPVFGRMSAINLPTTETTMSSLWTSAVTLRLLWRPNKPQPFAH